MEEENDTSAYFNLDTHVPHPVFHPPLSPPLSPRSSPLLSPLSPNLVIDSSKEPKVYWSRWWVLFLFAFLAFNQSLIWITFSPITDITKAYYGISESSVDLMLNWVRNIAWS